MKRKQMEMFEDAATAMGIPPEEELRGVLGYCIGRLLRCGAPPAVLKAYLADAVDAAVKMFDIPKEGQAK